MPSTAPRSRLAAGAAAGLLALAALTACSSSDSGASGGATSTEMLGQDGSGGVDSSTTGEAAAPRAGAAPKAADGFVAVEPAVAQQKVVRRADLSVQVEDVQKAAAAVRDIATTAGGVVTSENISTDPGPEPMPVEPGGDATTGNATTGNATSRTSTGTITVSVPADQLDATLDRLAEVGTVLSRAVSTDDVTAQYVDTDSRVKSARASVDRVRALMSRATKIGDVVALESELSRRQADLEALESTLKALDTQVALSPVSVRLSTPDAPVTEPDDTGFLAGLTAGWDAFRTSVTVLLTVLGALLPFAVAAVVVIVPFLVWWRRRQRTPAATTPAAPPPAPSA